MTEDDTLSAFATLNSTPEKAIVYSRYGPPEVLRLVDVAKPSPGDDEVLIRVWAAEATKADCEMRSFKFAVKWFWLALRLAAGVTRPGRRILGGYFAAEIASLLATLAGETETPSVLTAAVRSSFKSAMPAGTSVIATSLNCLTPMKLWYTKCHEPDT